jgi:hypothetical protein
MFKQGVVQVEGALDDRDLDTLSRLRWPQFQNSKCDDQTKRTEGSVTADVRFGSKADMCSATGHVRFVPIADIKMQASILIPAQPYAFHREISPWDRLYRERIA